MGLVPGLLLLGFYYKKDKLEPEPIAFVLGMYLLGGLVALPAVLAERPLAAWPVFALVVATPVLEEGVKFLLVRHTIYRHAEFDEPMDGIVYAAAAALGFATAENVLYLWTGPIGPEPLSPLLAGWLPEYAVGVTFMLRAMLSVPGHALWSTVWGYALGRARFMAAGPAATRLVAGAFVAACALHGLHNLLTLLSPWVGLAGLSVLAFVLWRWLNRNIAVALRESPFHPDAAVPAAATEASGALEAAASAPPVDTVP